MESRVESGVEHGVESSVEGGVQKCSGEWSRQWSGKLNVEWTTGLEESGAESGEWQDGMRRCAISRCVTASRNKCRS